MIALLTIIVFILLEIGVYIWSNLADNEEIYLLINLFGGFIVLIIGFFISPPIIVIIGVIMITSSFIPFIMDA